MRMTADSIHVVLRTSHVRCLIVDDRATFRTAASTLLESGSIHVVGVASTAVEALERYRQLRPDVTLVDVDLGADSGFDVFAKLSVEGTPPPMILISTHSEDDFADMIARSPAVGSVPKFVLPPDATRHLLAST